MPADDVSDLRDVVDAINRLCDTMKTSHYEDVPDELDDDDARPHEAPEVPENSSLVPVVGESVAPAEVPCPPPEMLDLATEILRCVDVASPEEAFEPIEVLERWSDSTVSLPAEMTASDAVAPCEPASEMYYTASSEVSLLSDTEVPERAAADDDSPEGQERDDRKECVIAGHVAAMRERFESMTRTNTPCPDLIRSTSPSLDVFRNITPSPDRLG